MIMRSSGWLVLPVLAVSLAATACGSSEDKGSGSSATAAAPATQKAVAAPPTRPPDRIQVDTALPEAPPKGKKLIFLQCELPACQRYVPGVKAAAAALGWSAKIEVFKNADPGAGLQQA